MSGIVSTGPLTVDYVPATADNGRHACGSSKDRSSPRTGATEQRAEQSLNHDALVGNACWAARVTAGGSQDGNVAYQRAGVCRRPDAWTPRLPSGSVDSTENMRRREQFRLSLQASWAKSKNAGG